MKNHPRKSSKLTCCIIVQFFSGGPERVEITVCMEFKWFLRVITIMLIVSVG